MPRYLDLCEIFLTLVTLTRRTVCPSHDCGIGQENDHMARHAIAYESTESKGRGNPCAKLENRDLGNRDSSLAPAFRLPL